MGSDRRNRERRTARGAPSRSARRRILIVCEGEVTEPEYFRGFERWARNNTVQIDIPIKRSQGLALVERATRLKCAAESAARREADAFLAYDEGWCAFDVDDNDQRNLNEARQLAGANSIELAVSNPCFELWLWLHFKDSPGARHRYDLQRMLREFLPGYDKHLEFDQVSAGIADATRRARRLDEYAQEEGEAGRNPSTDVYRLTDSIARDDSAPAMTPCQ